MVVFGEKVYKSKAEVVRDLFESGVIKNDPEDKKRIARLLGITPQTVHATIIKYLGIAPGKSHKTTSVPSVDRFKSTKEAITEAYNRCYDIASARAKTLPKIDILWNLTGTTAGMFMVKYGKPCFRVNLQLADENVEDYIYQTVPHEFCHYLVWVDSRLSFGHRPRPHGKEWQYYMVTWYDRVPKRTHSYDISNACRGNRFEYKCGCRTFMLSGIKHRRAQKGVPYICKKCHQKVVYQG